MRTAMMAMTKLMREAQSDAVRLNIADQARGKGDNKVAGRIYLGLAVSRLATPATVTAKQRLAELDQEARDRLADIQRRLAEWRSQSPGEMLESPSLAQLAQYIAEFDDLADQYGRIPKIGRDITSALAKERNQPQARAALSEPDAKRLWEEGQSLEAEGHVCCAYLLYEEAARKSPAPSARTAAQRLAELRADPRNMIAAESCRTLQWCHQQYRLAERVASENPTRAKELFAQILERAPPDSTIHVEAKKRLDQLH